ncbi:UDP-N-acetylmuramate--L-alanine ligase, partial [bacterium]
EADHLDVYGDIEGVERGFADFVARLPRHGTLVYNADDARCVRVARQAPCRRVSFGEAEGADWRLTGLDAGSGLARADVWCQGERIGALSLNVPGQVYAFNALGALAAAHWAGADSAGALEALSEYRGVKRRFEMLGRFKGAPLIDDYAHHPSAVKQLLQAARDAFASRRLVAVFQAHQYQRLNGFFEEFVQALALADRVLVMRTYAAREQGVIPGIPEQALCRELQALGVDALALEHFGEAAAELDASTQARDALVFIGAGDVNEIALGLLAHGPSLTRSAA